MNAPLQLLLPIGLVLLSVFATGVYMLNRGQRVSLNGNVREALLWGGGFIIYAVFDYLILMH
jgi:hypothetical protein